ncbi:vacuolar membrane-associated protein iml1 [Thelotrema lepadinum]|nr:vacuolar membrane-associated protein iml1 [Thelotrema lepadinum]
MWRLVTSELAGKPLHKGQKVLFINSIRVQIKSIYRQGRKVYSAFFGTGTKPVFRSESARYVLFIQMSKEMWEFEPEGTGEIMFNKVIGGFLPQLFAKWQDAGARHLLTIVLFTRMEYEKGSPLDTSQFRQGEAPKLPLRDDSYVHKDFYRVLISDMASGKWSTILTRLKRGLRDFLREVSVQSTASFDSTHDSMDYAPIEKERTIETIAGRPAPAARGNILEAINLASSEFAEDYVDRDLVRTGLSIIVITPGAGIFEVDAGLLNLTTDLLTEAGVGIDLVCLSRVPLHSVPLFKYKDVGQRLQVPPRDSVDERTTTAADLHAKEHHHTVYNLDSRKVNQKEKKQSYNSRVINEWRYAIPHWVDVSFWNSPLVFLGEKNPSEIRSLVPAWPRNFIPRVRMYEVQMMGIMENEVNNISIPSLRKLDPSASVEANTEHANALQPRGSLSSLSSALRKNESFQAKALDALSTSFSPKSALSLNNIKPLSSVIRWMDGYDESLFHCFEKGKQSTVVSKQGRPERSTAPRDNMSFHDALPQANPSITKHEEINGDVPALPTKSLSPTLSRSTLASRKNSNTGNSLKPYVHSPRPKGSARQSSFGFRGFGGAAPKAMPVTELSSEVAHRASILSGDLERTSQLRSKVFSLEESYDKSDVKLGKDLLVPTIHQPSQAEGVAQASKPIEIRNKHRLSSSQEVYRGTKEVREGEDMLLTDGQSESEPDSCLPAKRASASGLMAPWLTLLNPSNPGKAAVDASSRLGRWQHVFPRPLSASNIKWKSLCSPASIPLTTEVFPSSDQFTTAYETNSYSVSVSDSLIPEDQRHSICLIREMISARFAQGFQIIVGSSIASALKDASLTSLDIFGQNRLDGDGSTTYMSRGSQIHQLTHWDHGMVEVKIYSRRTTMEGPSSAQHVAFHVYCPLIRTALGDKYERNRIHISSFKDKLDWHRFDSYISQREERKLAKYPENLPFWRARFVFIPMQNSSDSKKVVMDAEEDNDEEVRLEGIYKLAQIWQRDRYVVSTDEKLHSLQQKVEKLNPLDLIFRTRSPSAVVISELRETLLNAEPNKSQTELLPESELFDKSNLNLTSLAQAIQSERGVRLQDRRWHWRLHYNCFIGIELVTWLLENFRDMKSREEAVELGNMLMREGLFVHVEKRHNFRDGNFFYQFKPEYRQSRSEGRNAWFPRLSSVPSTPVTEGSKNTVGGLDSQPLEESSPDDRSATPTEKAHTTTKVVLSKQMIYDGDRRKKSYRSEAFSLHYDRISSADDCYHVRVDWVNVTPKLIEDSVSNWSSAAERFGLRLVELPIREASRVKGIHAFQSPYFIKLAKPPPEDPLLESFDAVGIGPRPSGSHPYQKALLRKFDFVLDMEAAKDFPATVDVSYSWGKPDYRFTQYISREGVLLVQITDEGDFLLLANRLFNSRGATARTNNRMAASMRKDLSGRTAHRSPMFTSTRHRPGSPRASPLTSPFAMSGLGTGQARQEPATPKKIKDDLEAFCSDAKALEKFYREVREKAALITPRTPAFDVSGDNAGVPTWSLEVSSGC